MGRQKTEKTYAEREYDAYLAALREQCAALVLSIKEDVDAQAKK